MARAALPSARGAAAEDAAQRFLERQGLKLVARNFRCPGGELDLVMRERDTLALVEVRSRGRSDFGSAAESITARKRARLVLAARSFLAAHPEHARQPVRFDVVAFDRGGAPQWLKNAFEAEE
jgi:putative endonuclease